MTNLVPVSDIEKMAAAVASSGLFGIKTKEQAMALMLIAQAEGLHPAIAARDYHVIQGRPSLKADAMLARFQTAGGSVKWNQYDDKKVSGTFSHPQGGSVEIDWTIEKAKQLGFMSKDNWKNYPRAMMRARCISEGIRTVFPGCVVGVYTPEEEADFKPKEMGPAEVVSKDGALHESIVSDYVAALEACADIDSLHAMFEDAYKWAKKVEDIHAEAKFISAKDARKEQLQ